MKSGMSKQNNSLLEALHEAQNDFAGEAERVGLKDESDVVKIVKDIREMNSGKWTKHDMVGTET